jgi:hypothetical protein
MLSQQTRTQFHLMENLTQNTPLVMGANPQPPNWEFEQQGAAQNLGVFGGNPHPAPVQQFHPIQFQAALDDM